MINEHDAKSITFENIEQTAEVTLLKLLSTDSKTEQMFHAIRLESLKHMAELKSTIAWQAERKESHELNKQQTEAMTAVAAKVPAPAKSPQEVECSAAHPTSPGLTCQRNLGHEGNHGRAGVFWETPEPTKPAADRLHELLSMWNGFSADQSTAARGVTVADSEGAESRGYLDGQSVAWGKAASMLQDILQEGSI